jgi:hypothetical protein
MGASPSLRNSSLRNSSSSGPYVVNGGFEEGSTTDDFKEAEQIQGWSLLGDGVILIKSGSATYGGVKSSRGEYLVGLVGMGTAVFQSVGRHIPGNWYKLVFHSAYRTSQGDAKLKVSIDGKVKMNEAVYSGTLGWYEVNYKAPYADVVICFENAGPTGDRGVYVDGIAIEQVVLWDAKKPDTEMVLIQKVECGSTYPSNQTCVHGHYLSSGDFEADGTSAIIETDVASARSIWVATHEGNRWAFKSATLTQEAEPEGHAASGTHWYLHSDYTKCEARNWHSRATSTFDVGMNEMRVHVLSDGGAECGSLFAIQRHLNIDVQV